VNDLNDAIMRRMTPNAINAPVEPDDAMLDRALVMKADRPAEFDRLPSYIRRLANEHATKATGDAA